MSVYWQMALGFVIATAVFFFGIVVERSKE